MAVDFRRDPLDQLTEWMLTTGGAMSGFTGDWQTIEEALPALAGNLMQAACAALEKALGAAPAPGQLRIGWAPGRLRVCLGDACCESAVSMSEGTLEEAVISACWVLAESSAEY